MEHLANKLDARWLIGVLFFKVHHQAEGTILEGSIGGADNDGIPGGSSANVYDETDRQGDLSELTKS